jgi:predicted dehydrogenase
MKLALIGCGRWGKTLARVFDEIGVLAAIVDPAISPIAPGVTLGVEWSDDVRWALRSPEITAVAIATPSPTHSGLTLQALRAGKDVFVEKPMALCAGHAEYMVAVARQHKRILMVDNLLAHHPGLIKMAKRVARGDIGEVRRIDTVRIKPDDRRSEDPVLWRLAPHDVGIVLEIMGGYPTLLIGAGDNASAWLSMARGMMTAGVHVELRPSKAATIIVEGTKGKLHFDGLSNYLTDEDSAAFYEDANPLRAICEVFVWHCTRRVPAVENMQNGVDVVRVIEEGQKWISSHTPRR